MTGIYSENKASALSLAAHLPGWHFCASILTIRLEPRSTVMNLLVTTYTSSSSSLSSFRNRSLGYTQLLAAGVPGPLVEIPSPLAARAPQSLGLPPRSGADLWVQQHVQTGVSAAAVLLTSFVQPPVTARAQTLPGIGCRSRRRGLPGVKIKAGRGEYKVKPPKSHLPTSDILCCLR